MLRFLLALLLQQPTTFQVGNVAVMAPPAYADLAAGLAQLADRPMDLPGLGRRELGAVRLVVVADARRLRELSGGRVPEWGAGLAFPGTRTIVLRADADDLLRTLRHELAHLALHDAIRVRVPLWFDEGYAALAAGEWGRLDALALNLTIARGVVPDLRALDGALRGGAVEADAAYGLATSAVMELARRNPESSLGPLLARLVAGEDFGAAVQATTGLDLARFEDTWRRDVRRRYGLVAWLVAGGAWAILGLMVLVLARQRRRRDRHRREALNVGWEVPPDDETPLDPPGTPH